VSRWSPHRARAWSERASSGRARGRAPRARALALVERGVGSDGVAVGGWGLRGWGREKAGKMARKMACESTRIFSPASTFGFSCFWYCTKTRQPSVTTKPGIRPSALDTSCCHFWSVVDLAGLAVAAAAGLAVATAAGLAAAGFAVVDLAHFLLRALGCRLGVTAAPARVGERAAAGARAAGASWRPQRQTSAPDAASTLGLRPPQSGQGGVCASPGGEERPTMPLGLGLHLDNHSSTA
jgi:hypothetical protein